MKLPDITILDEKNKLLHQKSKDVVFPMDKKEKDMLEDMLTYLEMSQIDKYSEKYNLRPGMGLAFVQVGVPKRAFVICNENDDGEFDKYIIINPEIISMSEEMIYVGEGEGCLSVNREVEGIVPRHARITIKAFDEEGKEFTLRVREDLAVAFQHEIDHLNGILFTDHINPKCPYKDKELMREI
ncbi:MAG: peptide deformylase [Bacilli bacterium]|nr:peptide deformylase [Bacilli bacterium]